jgi:hypothetical protein
LTFRKKLYRIGLGQSRLTSIYMLIFLDLRLDCMSLYLMSDQFSLAFKKLSRAKCRSGRVKSDFVITNYCNVIMCSDTCISWLSDDEKKSVDLVGIKHKLSDHSFCKSKSNFFITVLFVVIVKVGT